MKRIFWIVLDSAGIGEAPDAEQFGDVGSNTWKSCYDSGKLHIPNMEKIGICRLMVWNMQKVQRIRPEVLQNAGIIMWKGYDDRTLGNGGYRNTGSTSEIPGRISESIHRGIFKKDGKKDSV